MTRHSDLVEWTFPLNDIGEEPSDDDDDRSDWIMRDLIPHGEPWILSGLPKTGKTWTALSLVIHVALGRDWLSFENCLGRPGRVLLLANEDSAQRTRKRIWQICRGLDIDPGSSYLRRNLRFANAPLQLPGQEGAFIECVTGWGAEVPDLIVIDSVSRVMVGDQNSSADAVGFTTAWGKINKATGASVGFIHHNSKPTQHENRSPRGALNKIRGSGEFSAFPRNTISMAYGRTSNEARVTMAGNLDLTRDSFALGFERREVNGRVSIIHRECGKQESAERAEKEGEVQRRDLERAILQLGAQFGGTSFRAIAESRGTNTSNASRAYGAVVADLITRGYLAHKERSPITITAEGSRFLAVYSSSSSSPLYIPREDDGVAAAG